VLVAIATAAVLALRRRVHLLVLAAPAVLIWLGLAHAHVHPTLAGVILGMLVPAEPERATRVEQALHPWVAFGVMPLFALANAGIDLRSPLANTSVLVAVAAGLVVGKTLGITGATALAVRLGIAKLPQGASWHGIVLVAAVAGIGFTMSLFVAGLAFGDRPDLEAAARLGMLVGSALAVAVAVPCSYLARRQRQSNEPHSRRG
jgi:Na+:H+ antiporter, NhaA family